MMEQNIGKYVEIIGLNTNCSEKHFDNTSLNAECMENYFADYIENICTDTDDTVEADKNTNEYIAKIPDADDSWETDWWHTQATYQHEKQGFFGGFLYAVALLKGGVAV